MAPGEHSSTAHSQAASLARTLWLSVPDAELLSVAEDSGSSKLSEETLRSQIHRMLIDKRSDRMIESFCDQWLNLRSWNKVSPSLKLYPKYDDLLHHYLPLETQTYLAYLIRENMPVDHLIDSDYTFLNQRLAQHYGIDGVTGQHLRKISFGSEVPRGGLLTMGSVLKVTTDGFDTSPILRGAWVSKNIVGTPISPPPEPVMAIEPEHGTAAKTLREQIEQHKNNATCYACHKNIDPYGFALENFDATGQWREKYRVEKPHRGTFQFRLQGYFREAGQVDASGEIRDSRFSDVFGLKKLLRLLEILKAREDGDLLRVAPVLEDVPVLFAGFRPKGFRFVEDALTAGLGAGPEPIRAVDKVDGGFVVRVHFARVSRVHVCLIGGQTSTLATLFQPFRKPLEPLE